ncbi:hypothetical protein ACFO9Q_03400 [Paenibacillus sp. GCM10023252]|uniref:hypothetical protein n=1 Tax=Paenibacillus sp. GCM10023252 TaxID=3252649 RepID=UPI003606BCCD
MPANEINRSLIQYQKKARKKIATIILISLVIYAILLTLVISFLKSDTFIALMLQNFTVTVENESDQDITRIEFGVLHSDDQANVIEGDSKLVYDRPLRSGKSVRITPDVSSDGEMSVFIRYTTAQGEVHEKSVCSYAEMSPRGRATIIIENNQAVVKEKCL